MNADPRRESQVFIVSDTAAGERLDRFLAEQLPAVSRAHVQQLVRAGEVWVDERVASRSAARLRAGARVAVRLPANGSDTEGLEPDPAVEYGVLYEDASIYVIDKPAGLVVHPAVGHATGTLVHGLLARDPHLADAFEVEADALRPGIVHRLDRDTSGVMVVARDPTSAAVLKAQFKSRSVRKVYLALTRGTVEPPAGVIDAPVGRDPHHRQRMRAMKGGRPARTAYRVLDERPHYGLLELRPETGRTHQIRVHLKAVGHPVIGDPVYGRNDRHIARLALHAWRLELAHPTSGRAMAFEAPIPADFARAMDALGLDGGLATPR